MYTAPVPAGSRRQSSPVWSGNLRNALASLGVGVAVSLTGVAGISGQAGAVPVEYPIISAKSSVFPSYTVSGTVRAQETGDVLNFGINDSTINLTPVGPAGRVKVVDLADTLVAQDETCVSLIVTICGGYEVYGSTDVYINRAAMSLTLDGVIDLGSMTSTAALIPVQMPLEAEIVVDSRIVLTGLFANLPGFIKDTLLQEAQDRLVNGTVTLTSEIVGMPSATSGLSVSQNGALQEVTIEQENLQILIPDFAFSGANNVQDFVLDWFPGIESDIHELYWKEWNDAANTTPIACPFNADPLCRFVLPTADITFQRTLAVASVPEPTGLALFAAGLAGIYTIGRWQSRRQQASR